MRKFFILLITLFAFCCSAFSQSDDEDVIIINVTEKIVAPPKTNHAPARPQIECYYYPSSNSVELSFLSNLGMVTVVLENLTTGKIQAPLEG